jgi:malonate-semialdehyde dehydrogenase (acetylating)/methylmalonate-semialdehyde dehydrogenase
MLDVVGHWIDGTPTPGVGDRAGELRDPVTGAVTAEIAYAVSSDVDAAAAAARVAFRTWGAASHAERAEVLARFRDLLETSKGEIATAVASEQGKSFSDALGEVARGLEAVNVACGIPRALDGAPLVTGANFASLQGREPHGVVAVVCSSEFPAMAPLWLFPLALASGNAVIYKPDDAAPTAAALFAQLWADACLPHGGFNVLHGDRQTDDALVRHVDVAAVSVVGPARAAHAAHTAASAHGKHVHALGRAKSHLVVLPGADLDLATRAALSAGIGPAGDCAMAMSVVVVVESAADALIDRIRRRLRAERASRPHDTSSRGALDTRAHRADVDRFVDAGLRSGAQLSVDGRGLAGNDDPVGFWLAPTVLDRVTPDMDVYGDDVFGPVLLVVRVATAVDALALIRKSPFVTAVSLFTDEPDAGRLDQGNLGVETVAVNVPTALPLRYRSWGDWKVSFFADPYAHGAQGAAFYTRADRPRHEISAGRDRPREHARASGA